MIRLAAARCRFEAVSRAMRTQAVSEECALIPLPFGRLP
jgi:hypothetical protein